MEERHLSLSEATRALGISERTAYRWINSGKLRAYKPGRDYRIPESAIREVIEESEVRPKESTSSQPSFNVLLEEEERRGVLAEIRENFRETREGLEAYCDAWERRIAVGDLDREPVQGFLEAADPLVPAVIHAVMREVTAISHMFDAAEDRVSEKMLAESSLKPAVDRYFTIGRKLQVMWQERFAETQPAKATRNEGVFDLLDYKDAKLMESVNKRAASG